MKKSILKPITSEFMLTVILLLLFVGGCYTEKHRYGFKYIDATVDDLSGKQFEAILIRISGDPDKTHMWAVIGDLNKAQKIVGYEINADKIVDSSWIHRLASDFINAERGKTDCMSTCRVIFLAKRRGYEIKISGDDKIVCGPDFQSKQISEDFKEMGLEKNYGLVDIKEVVKSRKSQTSEVEMSATGIKYVDATIDDLREKKFEAILIRSVDDPDNTHMWAVIGDLNVAQKIVGHEINADRVVDSSWIQRLASHFIKAERLKRLCMCDGRVIFLTKGRGYVIKMSSDPDDKMVYGPDYQSRQLWWDFREIGLE